MKKDIEIPVVSHVEVVAILEKDAEFEHPVWTIYLMNLKSTSLKTVLIVSEGHSDTKTTSVLRKKIEHLPAQSMAKIEFIQDELIAFENRFKVSFFENNQLLHKDFKFKPHQITEANLEQLQLVEQQGVLAE